LVEIKQLFETAEDYSKLVETNLGLGLVVPTVNELRYCGKHLLDACTGEDVEENLRRAKSHCQRAIYDASEAASLAALQSFDDFRTRYDTVQIRNIVSGYQEICKNFRELRKATSERIENEEKYRWINGNFG